MGRRLGRSHPFPVHVNRQTIRTPWPKLETLTDDFAGTLVKWPGAFGSPTIVAGQCQIAVNVGYDQGIQTFRPLLYDLIESYMFVEMFPPAVGAGTKEVFFNIQYDLAGTNFVGFYLTGTSFRARYKVNGAATTLATTTYSAVNHAWWRIRESAGTIYWDTSTDGAAWSNMASVATATFPTGILGEIYPSIFAGFYGAEGASNLLVDNVNVQSLVNATVTPNTVAAVAAVPAPTVSGAATVAAVTVAAVAAVPAPTVLTAMTVPAVTVAAIAAVPAPALSTGSIIAAVTVAAVAAVPAPSLSTGSTVTPATVAAIAAVPAPAVSAGGATIPVVTVAAIAAVPTPSISTGSTVSAVTVAAVAAVPTPAVVITFVVPAVTVAAIAKVPLLEISTGSTVSAVRVAAIAAVPAPFIDAGNIQVHPATVAAVAAVPTPAVSTGSTVSAVTVRAIAVVPTPFVDTIMIFCTPVVADVPNILCPMPAFGQGPIRDRLFGHFSLLPRGRTVILYIDADSDPAATVNDWPSQLVPTSPSEGNPFRETGLTDLNYGPAYPDISGARALALAANPAVTKPFIWAVFMGGHCQRVDVITAQTLVDLGFVITG